MSSALNSREFAPTPPAVAALLVRWALRSAGDVVLDPEPGPGAFLLESARRLQALGTAVEGIIQQLCGIDSRPETATILRKALNAGELPANLRSIRTGGLFTPPSSPVDVLTGNLPFQRQSDVEILRSAVSRLPEAAGCWRLTDPQCLLLIYSAGFLKPGGRMAVMISDGWLDMRNGTAFKDYLLRTFVMQGVLGFHKAVLPQSPVRLVALLATRRAGLGAGSDPHVSFVCQRTETAGGLPSDLDTLLKGQTTESARTSVAPDALKPRRKWSPFLYAPDAYKALRDHPGLTPLSSLARVRLGLQSFANRFYFVSLAELQRWQLERRWLMPLLMSPRQLDTPCVSYESSPRHYVLACREGKVQLSGTQLLRYIEYWENQVLAPRGQGRPVIGIQNLPGVSKTGRRPWYNLLDQLSRRGTAPVLLPRRLYRRPRVVWNQAGWVAGENFIEITPRSGIPAQSLLAVLNASLSEMALRVNANVYGGVYSLNPGSVGDVPVLDIRRLEPPVMERITGAYSQFLRINGSQRGKLDAAVFAAAGLPDSLFPDLQATLAGMRNPEARTSPPALKEEGGSFGEPRLL